MTKLGNKNFFKIGPQIEQMVNEYDLAASDLYATISKALKNAYQREINPDNELLVEIDEKVGILKLWEQRKVVETIQNPNLEITLNAAQTHTLDAQIDQIIKCPFDLTTYHRFAIGYVKQAIKHFINVSESQKIYDKYISEVGKILVGTVENIESRYYSVFLGDTFAFVPKSEQIPNERVSHGQRVKIYVQTVHRNHPYGQIQCSRRSPEFLKCLFKLEIPEVEDYLIEIKQIVREAGIRSKVAVICHDERVEPIGTCIGQGGMRIKAISQELNGEKIDIFLWNSNWEKLMINAFTPAKVIHYQVDEAAKRVLVIVHSEQYPNAIGKIGSAVRLIAQLIDYQVDVEKIEDFAQNQSQILLNGNLTLQELERIELDPSILAKCSPVYNEAN